MSGSASEICAPAHAARPKFIPSTLGRRPSLFGPPGWAGFGTICPIVSNRSSKKSKTRSWSASTAERNSMTKRIGQASCGCRRAWTVVGPGQCRPALRSTSGGAAARRSEAGLLAILRPRLRHPATGLQRVRAGQLDSECAFDDALPVRRRSARQRPRLGTVAITPAIGSARFVAGTVKAARPWATRSSCRAMFPQTRSHSA